MQTHDSYRTVLVITTALLLFYWWKQVDALLYIALVINMLCIFFPALSSKISQLWYKLAFVLGWVNARILLTAIFFIVLLPVALLRRILTSEKKQHTKNTYYITRNHFFNSRDMENPW